MKRKYEMSLEQNIFVARKYIVDSVYSGAKLEGSNITFPETYAIYEGANVGNVALQDVLTVVNLKHAWQYLLSNITAAFDIDFLCKLNGFIAQSESLEWGTLRKGNVSISGTNYKPQVPNREQITADILNILNDCNTSETEKAIHIFLYISRSQMFWDGNKRTAMLAANKLLISKGLGIFTVPTEILVEFHSHLTTFYETNDYATADKFIYDNCITGICFDEPAGS